MATYTGLKDIRALGRTNHMESPHRRLRREVYALTTEDGGPVDEMFDAFIESRLSELYGGCKARAALGDVCELRYRTRQLHYKASDPETAGDCLLVTGADIKGGRIDYTGCRRAGEAYCHSDPKAIVEEGDVLTSMYGGSRGIAVVSGLPMPAIAGANLLAFRTRNDDFDSEYVRRCLLSLDFRHFLNATRGRGVTDRLNLDAVRGYEIPAADAEDQQLFVDFAQQVDKAREVARRLYSCFDDIVGSKLSETIPDTDLYLQKDSWRRLGDVASIAINAVPITNDHDLTDGDTMVVTSADIGPDAFTIHDTKRRTSKSGRLSNSLVEQGTVLLSTGLNGGVALAGAEMCCGTHVLGIKCGQDVDSLFLYALLRQNKEYLGSLRRGPSRQIPVKNLKDMRIPVPPIEKQREFADFLRQTLKARESFFDTL